ncbi:MAG TPA: hypothetical protein VF041_02590 [Gemmatimonadaceae bacterium]
MRILFRYLRSLALYIAAGMPLLLLAASLGAVAGPLLVATRPSAAAPST